MTNAQRTAAVTETIQTGEVKMAAAIGRRLGCDVEFLGWQKSPRKGGPESPIFGVPAPFVARAVEFGFDAWQFRAFMR